MDFYPEFLKYMKKIFFLETQIAAKEYGQGI